MYIVPWWLWHSPLAPLVLPYTHMTLVYSVLGGFCLVATTLCIIHSHCAYVNAGTTIVFEHFACYKLAHLIHIIKATMATMSRIAVSREAIIVGTSTATGNAEGWSSPARYTRKK